MMCTHCLLSLEILRFAFQERPNLSVFYYLWLLSWYFRLTQTHCFNYLCFTGLETNKSCFDCFLKQSTWSLERVKIHLGLAGQLRAARSDHEPSLMMHKTSPAQAWLAALAPSSKVLGKRHEKGFVSEHHKLSGSPRPYRKSVMKR